jgi:hypothetical protein
MGFRDSTSVSLLPHPGPATGAWSRGTGQGRTGKPQHLAVWIRLPTFLSARWPSASLARCRGPMALGEPARPSGPTGRPSAPSHPALSVPGPGRGHGPSASGAPSLRAPCGANAPPLPPEAASGQVPVRQLPVAGEWREESRRCPRGHTPPPATQAGQHAAPWVLRVQKTL